MSKMSRMPRISGVSRGLVALACIAIWFVGTRAAGGSSEEMAGAAAKFVGALGPAERQQGVFAFESAERLHWHFIPSGPAPAFPRNGLPVKNMTPAQLTLAHGLLKTGLSQSGYLTATSIMELETVLGDLEQRGRLPAAAGMIRDRSLYFFSIFGTPSTRATWGWRVEGHHVSLQFTIVNGTMTASSPSFFGSNPAEVREGPKAGLRILGREEDTARALLEALNPSQRQKALINTVAPGDIVTANRADISPLSPSGVTFDALNAGQRDLLMTVVDAYTSAMASDIAADRLDKIRKAGVEKLAFAWAGEAERGKRHYYRVQGPTFLIEYDNTQNDANHVHSVWRDFAGDFGRDLLRDHVTSAH